MVAISQSKDLLALQRSLETCALPSPVVLCDELSFGEFVKNKNKYESHRLIFYGSRNFINQQILQDKTLENLWAAVIEQGTAPSWSPFIRQLLSSCGGKLVTRLEITSHPPQKEEALDAVENSLKSFSIAPRIRRHLLDTCDELLMNALYDAPYTKEQGYIHNQTPRNAPITLVKPVVLELYEENENLRLEVTDFYGSLKKSSIQDHLSRQYSNTPYIVDNTKAGAGLGIAQSFKKGANLAFECIPFEKTTVKASFKIVDSYREAQLCHKFIIFNVEKVEEIPLKKAV